MTRTLLAALLLLCSEAHATLLLGIHAEEPAPSIGALIAQLAPQDIPLRIMAFDSSAQVADALQDGAIDLGIVEDRGRMLPGIALVADLYPSVLHILHRESGQPADLGALLTLGGVWAGPPGSLGYRLSESLAADFGLAPTAVKLLEDPWSVDPDVYFMFGGILDPDALSRLPGFALYSLDAPEALRHGSVAEGVALRHPYLRPFILPAQLYPTLGSSPALTLAVNNALVAREDLSVDKVYELAMALKNMEPRIAADYPLAGISRGDSLALPRALPLHPGAARFRDRDLPGFLERYAEVLALGATLLIAAGSVGVAVRRQRRQSRKDRLDIYYQRLLELRRQIARPGTDVREVADQVRDTQAEVMALVIDERIDADGSLMAFLTLSNRLLDEAAA